MKLSLHQIKTIYFSNDLKVLMNNSKVIKYDNLISINLYFKTTINEKTNFYINTIATFCLFTR